MKNLLKSLALLGLGAVAFAPFARAADETPSTPPAAPAADHPRPARGERLKMLAEKLQLTDAQKAQVKTIMQKGEEQAKALRSDDSLDKDDRRSKMMEIRKSTHDQIRALLTPDQQKNFDAMPPQRGGHRGPPTGDGDAPPTTKQ
ncbi:MAG: Spy/CpxP family protein refolding chaperone [Opitutaceae bacterium]